MEWNYDLKVNALAELVLRSGSFQTCAFLGCQRDLKKQQLNKLNLLMLQLVRAKPRTRMVHGGKAKLYDHLYICIYLEYFIIFQKHTYTLED